MFEKTYVVAGENAEINWLQREYIPRPSTAKALEVKERLENVMNYYKLGESTRYRLLLGMVEAIE